MASDERPIRRDRIRDPEKAALLRRLGIPQQLIGPAPPVGWRVDRRRGAPVVYDDQGREVPDFAFMLAGRNVELAVAERDGIAFSRWPREDPAALAAWLAKSQDHGAG